MMTTMMDAVIHRGPVENTGAKSRFWGMAIAYNRGMGLCPNYWAPCLPYRAPMLRLTDPEKRATWSAVS